MLAYQEQLLEEEGVVVEVGPARSRAGVVVVGAEVVHLQQETALRTRRSPAREAWWWVHLPRQTAFRSCTAGQHGM